MPGAARTTLITLLLLTAWPWAGAAPAPDDILRARVALRFDPDKRCPEVRAAGPDEDAAAVVLFQVGPTGVPSNASVTTSSGSTALDAAAVKCVLALRFQPATQVGDGAPMESWQRISWKAAPVRYAPAAAPAPAASAAAGATVAASATVATPIPPAAAAPGAADVQVCVDGSGQLARTPALTHSSGDAAFDAAAVQVAKSASGSYRSGAGCLQLSLRPAQP